MPKDFNVPLAERKFLCESLSPCCLECRKFHFYRTHTRTQNGYAREWERMHDQIESFFSLSFILFYCFYCRTAWFRYCCLNGKCLVSNGVNAFDVYRAQLSIVNYTTLFKLWTMQIFVESINSNKYNDYHHAFLSDENLNITARRNVQSFTNHREKFVLFSSLFRITIVLLLQLLWSLVQRFIHCSLNISHFNNFSIELDHRWPFFTWMAVDQLVGIRSQSDW